MATRRPATYPPRAMSSGLRHRGRAPDHLSATTSGAADTSAAKGETAIWHRGPALGRRGAGRTALLLSIVAALAIALAFAVAYGQAPLYTGDQHASLLRGLAQAGAGLLELDWQARTTDPTPIASLVVAATQTLGAQWLMLVLHAVLVGAYGLALFGLATKVCGVARGPQRLVLLAALVFVHSWLAGEIGLGLPQDLRSLATGGVAGQSAAAATFGPSLFGVLLVVSLLAYAHGRSLAAIGLAAAAAVLNPAYLLCALVLSGAYLADTVVNTGARRTIVSGAALAVAALTPVVLYLLVAFTPVAPSLHEAAQDVLVDFVLPQHAKPEVWFGLDDGIRLGIVAVGLVLAWRSPLFPVLALAVTAGAVLTALALITSSETLALLFPWRLSVVLVPVATAIVLATAVQAVFAFGRGVERLVGRYSDGPPAGLVTVGRTLAYVLAGLVIGVSLVIGIDRLERLDPEPRASALGRLVAAERLPGDLYLVPPRPTELRLDGGVPVYVDLLAHPYEDREVLEWRRRLDEVARVYPGGTLRCRPLASLVRGASISHVVVESPTRARCRFLRRAYAVGRYSVFTVTR